MSMNLKKKSIAHVFNVIIVMQKLLGPTACNKTFLFASCYKTFHKVNFIMAVYKNFKNSNRISL